MFAAKPKVFWASRPQLSIRKSITEHVWLSKQKTLQLKLVTAAEEKLSQSFQRARQSKSTAGNWRQRSSQWTSFQTENSRSKDGHHWWTGKSGMMVKNETVNNKRAKHNLFAALRKTSSKCGHSSRPTACLTLLLQSGSNKVAAQCESHTANCLQTAKITKPTREGEITAKLAWSKGGLLKRSY